MVQVSARKTHLGIASSQPLERRPLERSTLVPINDITSFTGLGDCAVLDSLKLLPIP